MNRIATLLATLILIIGSAFSQTSYNDVLVIVNDSSSISQQVGTYFKTQRGIPTVNMCHFYMPTTEEIDSSTCAGIYTQIKNYMISNSLVSSINYIVTTQGVPLKVRRSSSVFDYNSNASSFDSDLCLLNSTSESQIGKPSYIANPYHGCNLAFSRSTSFGNIVLVTRLAGYTYNDIVGLIDRAVQPYHSNGMFVFDQDPAWSSYFNTRMQIAKDTLSARGYSTLLNTTSSYAVNQVNVLGYVSWGSNDHYWSLYTQKAQPHFTWSAKALAETYVSSSGRTFVDSTFVEPTIGWQSLVADLIHENGVTGVKGYVFEPYTTALAKVDILFERWSRNYNLAESYYAASYCLGWMDVVIGDPKSKLTANGHLPVELVAFGGNLHGASIQLFWKTATETNNFGFEIEKNDGSLWEKIGFIAGGGTTSSPRDYSFSDDSPQAENLYRLKQIDRDGSISYSHVIDIVGRVGENFEQLQSYPNPFSESTVIKIQVQEPTDITLDVFNVLGQKITNLAQNVAVNTGIYSIPWSGVVESGNLLQTGTYFCVASLKTTTSGFRTLVKRLSIQR